RVTYSKLLVPTDTNLTMAAYRYSHERYSSCYAAGTLKFDDGSSGKWDLSSSGVATFIFTRGDAVTLFYKNNKWYDPFACTYGLGDVGEC
ncbi:hypothetical protein ACGTRS_30080, partial [Burkholderia semiarida]